MGKSTVLARGHITRNHTIRVVLQESAGRESER
jgi:hypothetical protein